MQFFRHKKRRNNTRGLSERTFDYFYKNIQIDFISPLIQETTL
jgi:hypothetical protein